MKTSLLVVFISLSLGSLYAQKEKVKGNKIVSTEQLDVDAFHSIEIYDNFEITLDESSDPELKIEADSNLQEMIIAEVQDSILTIKSSKDLRRAKALNLDIAYASELKKITIYDKVNAKSLSPINSANLHVEINDNAEVFFTIDAGKVRYSSNGKASGELHVTAVEAIYQINDNSELKGIVSSDSLNVDLYQKASAKLEGEVKSTLVRADNDTDFYGDKLISNKMSIVSEANSDCFIHVSVDVSIDAKDKAEIYILGDPKISIDGFANEATLYKKNIDYTPSKLRFN
ncbi:GIN domain-containing protein [Aquimarina algicola]|uniref:Putative auto-transporter adhesin head GIN domain-containing protein n=1 Tax=Aquimarina algicola TaxID=2589995 RepID=A0A504JEB7_9FLAO|nr:DUF2807 domain-containing protein [Aquimarina algicola]TPN85209.1 hypothetical protein FHK87_14365 [Aquimarina algicola]